MIDPPATSIPPMTPPATDGREWFIVLDTADDLSWWRDELIFAASSRSAEAHYRAEAAGAGHTPGTVLVCRTNFYYYVPDDLPGYVAVAESTEFEAGEITITLNYQQKPVKKATCAGRVGLLALVTHVGAANQNDHAAGMAGLLRAAMSQLLIGVARSRGAITVH